MKKLILFLLALVGLPFLWALAVSVLRCLALDAVPRTLFTAGQWWFVGGGVVMTMLYVWKGRKLSPVYVFAHEMTHALAGVCCGARIHRVSIRETGGFVELSKSNLFITLAPYCVPLYLLFFVLLRWIVDGFWPEAVAAELWNFVLGMAFLFHLLYTGDALLTVAQPDVRVYGRLFSYEVIVFANLLFAFISLLLIAHLSGWEQGRNLVIRTWRSYATVVHVASLPFNRSHSSPTSAPRGHTNE
ncbi:MAG: hypothetical protein RSD41_04940 [Kiritimatiellia bacterium]